jgi:hypothetical protein
MGDPSWWMVAVTSVTVGCASAVTGLTDAREAGDAMLFADVLDTAETGRPERDAAADAGRDVVRPADAPPLPLGYVGVYAVNRVEETVSFTELAYSAYFPEPEEIWSPAASACASEIDGHCVVTRCPGPAPSPRLRSAGTIVVSGGTGAPVTLRPRSDNRYDSDPEPLARWVPGDTVRLVASGAAVPAFDVALTIPVPLADVRVSTDPVSHRVDIDRATDFVFSWAPTTSARVAGFLLYQIVISPAGSPYLAASIDCTFDASAGSASVPRSALAALVPNLTDPDGTVVLIRAENLAQIPIPQGFLQAEASGVGFGARASVR